jgi:ribosomal protein S28E/S33
MGGNTIPAMVKELGAIHKHLEELGGVRKDDKDLFAFRQRFARFMEALRNDKYPVTLRDFLAIRQTERQIKITEAPTWWIREARKYLSDREIASLLGCSNSAINQRISVAEARGEDLTKPPLARGVKKEDDEGAWANGLQDAEPFEVYKKALKVLFRIIDDAENDRNHVGKNEAVRTLELVLRYSEPKVLERLQNLYTLLDDTANWMLSILIPTANKRAREVIREVEGRIKAGDKVEFLNFDLRTILRDLLPSFPDLRDRLMKEGWLQPEQQEAEQASA